MVQSSISPVHFQDTVWVTMEAHFSRHAWTPLDSAKINPQAAAKLGVTALGRLAVNVGNFRLVLLAVLDTNIRDGDVLLPCWLCFVLCVCEGSPTRVSSLSCGQTGKLRSGITKECACLEVEGPFTSPSADFLAPYLSMSRSHLCSALCRQVRRAGIRPMRGAVFAARISGHVCVFSVRAGFLSHSERNCSAGVADETCEAVTYCFPDAVVVRQPCLSSDLPETALGNPEYRNAALRCFDQLRQVGLLRGTQDVLQPETVLRPTSRARGGLIFEGAPSARTLHEFIGHLNWIMDDEGLVFAHLPLMELLWELPQSRDARAASRMLRELLAGFVQNTLEHGMGTAKQLVLVLWGLDGILPDNAKSWLPAALSPLKNLPSTCALIGLCCALDRVPPAFCELFDNGRASGEVNDVGLGKKFSANEVTSAGTEGSLCREPAKVVVGYEGALDQLRGSIINYFQEPDLFKEMGITWPPRLLLHGPAGAGKTHLLQWLCEQLPPGVRSRWLHSGEVLSRYVGESEERLRMAFANALEGTAGSGAVLVLEGLDQFAPHRHVVAAHERDAFRDRLVATLLVCLDGVDAPGPRGPSMNHLGLAVVATSATPAEDLDPRITRPGRMDRWIALEMPGAECCVALLRHFVQLSSMDQSQEKHVWSRLGDPGADVTERVVVGCRGMTPGKLRLVAIKAWNMSPSVPNWSDIIAALDLLNNKSSSLDCRATCSIEKLSAHRPPASPCVYPRWCEALEPCDFESLEAAANVAVPDDEDSDM